ncbi:hypothetical protein UREG_01002 [Uncinocarpus reesii 1704]|uniref:Oxidoreductase n=1 Tax=Uncinocarpus reesii (strain UAMH 1704) TaxID=336963 RepID=C4JFI8_UNCRE|nr:uncharacterized protein UREG_01002 [Uncinocarpus reesii 1704]EEP76153.1 hypothetical protein UREG_01002 [Uncinocarpus reesii 1704]
MERHSIDSFSHEKHMTPTSESTKLESEGGFVEYVGSGKLKDKKVLITGGDSGIGRSVAILMAREGADVTIVYLPDEQDDANVTKKAVEQEGKKCVLFAGNLMDNENCKKAVDEHVKAYALPFPSPPTILKYGSLLVRNRYGRVDVLVNNASKQIMCKDFAQLTWITSQHLSSNILQMFAMTNLLYTYEERELGIRVNAVAPGPVHTPLQPASRPPEQMEGFGSDAMIGRPGQPSEIAPTYMVKFCTLMLWETRKPAFLWNIENTVINFST